MQELAAIMDTTLMKEIAETIESLLKTIGLVVGAVWIYLKFIRTRENHPKIEFDVDVRLLGRQDNKIIIEIIANLENKGLVRHWINNFSCDILILKSEDPVIHGDKRINYQLLFEKHNPIKDDSNNERRKRIVWIPEDWYESFVDAGVKQQYTYLSDVPEVTTFISIYSQFFYKGNDFQTSQRTFSVNLLEKNNSR